MAKERPGVGKSKCLPPPAGTTKPFAGGHVGILPFGEGKDRHTPASPPRRNGAVCGEIA